MKMIWEEQDIKSGRYIIRQSATEGHPNVSFAASVTYKIGFIGSNGRICLISITDGMVIELGDKQKVAAHLNQDREGYRPLTQENLLEQIIHLQTQNEGRS